VIIGDWISNDFQIYISLFFRHLGWDGEITIHWLTNLTKLIPGNKIPCWSPYLEDFLPQITCRDINQEPLFVNKMGVKHLIWLRRNFLLEYNFASYCLLPFFWIKKGSKCWHKHQSACQHLDTYFRLLSTWKSICMLKEFIRKPWRNYSIWWYCTNPCHYPLPPPPLRSSVLERYWKSLLALSVMDFWVCSSLSFHRNKVKICH
jgi:hypothetical protein